MIEGISATLDALERASKQARLPEMSTSDDDSPPHVNILQLHLWEMRQSPLWCVYNHLNVSKIDRETRGLESPPLQLWSFSQL